MSENPEINEAEPTLEIPPKRGRGRPRKIPVKMSENPEINSTDETSKIAPKRGRGRPRKHVEISENTETNAEELTSDIQPKRGRDRPRKSDQELSENSEINETEVSSDIQPKHGRGTPRKSDEEISENSEINETVVSSDVQPKRGRGRPRKSDEETSENPNKKSKKLVTPKPPPLLVVKKLSGIQAEAIEDKFIQQTKNKLIDSTVKKKTGMDGMERKCAVPTCMYSSTEPGNKRSFHRLPNDERRSIWMYVAGITSLSDKHTYICNIHFNEHDYLQPKLLRYLRNNAIPTKHLPSQKHQLQNKAVYNDLTINPSAITMKLHETINAIKNFKKKYNEKYIDLILSFYMKNSSAYKILQKPLELVSPLQLKMEIYNNPINFSRFANLINKKLLMMNEQNKVCFVTCIQMAIEPKVFYCPKSDKLIGLSSWKNKLADSVKILIAHGVNSDWCIPLDIEYTYNVKTNTKNWIEQTLNTYPMLNVNAITWFPNYARLIGNLENFEVTFISHNFLDLQYTLKLLYFNLQSRNFSFGESIANWNDLKELYELDSKRTYPVAPHLNASNVNLNAFDQLTYEHVKEVFSEETAAALRAYTKAGLIKAEETAIFIENISLIIKLFNPNAKLTNEEKESTVRRVQEFLKSINKCFVDSLMIIMNIYDEDPELFSKMSKYLLYNNIHRFVDNILNNCIGEKPTSMNIENAFRKSFVENLLKSTKEDLSLDEALILAQTELARDPFCFFKTIESNKLQIKPSHCRLYMLEREDRILYVAGYILKKCLLYHNKCSLFKDYINNNTEDDKLLSKSIQKEIDEGNCMIIKNDFVEFIEILEITFHSHFNKFTMKDSLIYLFLKTSELQAIKFTSACPCFPLSYAKELFVRIRVEYLLSFTNMNYDAKSNVLQNISL